MRVRTIAIDPRPKGDGKFIAGADHDDWNDWLASLAASALPIDQNDEAVAIKATTALYHGMIDMKPADPVEGIIISQLMVANQASLALYQKAWAQPAEYFAARTKYLALADKAARTVVLLTERLDHHRNRGQQKIVVQHTTINADQAVVATGNATDPALLTASVEKPLQMIGKTIEPELVGVGEKKE
jgi:glycine/D-amino acid oxidase-like deaminating enzyme